MLRELKLLMTAALAAALSLGCSGRNDDDDDDTEDPGGPAFNYPAFVIGQESNGTDATTGLTLLTLRGGEPEYIPLTELVPRYTSSAWADTRGGRLVFRVKPELTPEGASGVAFLDLTGDRTVSFAPVPDAALDMYYDVPVERPVVFSDGRIAYRVTLNTVNPYDDWHSGEIAIYDPTTGAVELSGGTTDFVLGQPEQGGDTEAGSMDGPCSLSPNEKTLYCKAYGYGVDGGVFHVDYRFILAYTVGQPGAYARIAQTSGSLQGVTGDGRYLLVAGDGMERIDLTTLTQEKVDDYAAYPHTGQISRDGSLLIKAWRGSGLSAYDLAQSPAWMFNVVLGQDMTDEYKGLGHGAQLSADESEVYFLGSTDFYTNYCTPIRLFRAPVAADQTTPEVIADLGIEHCTDFFLSVGQ